MLPNSSGFRDFARLRLLSLAFGRTDNFLVIGLPTFAKIFIVMAACCAGGLIANPPSYTAALLGLQSLPTFFDSNASHIVIEAIALAYSTEESLVEGMGTSRASAEHVFCRILLMMVMLLSVAVVDVGIRNS